MNETVLQYDVAGEIAVITLNRPEKLNVLNTAMRDDLLDAWRKFEKDPTLRVAILTAAGSKSFCVGRDLTEATSGHGHGFLPILRDNVRVSKPVIAAVNGMALGGGCFLAISCDLCVASENATFGLTEARIGRAPIYAFWLNGIMPQKIALEMTMTGTPISAQRAYTLGLVNHVVAPEALMDKAMALANDICAAAPLSVTATKAMMYETAKLDDEAALEHSLSRFQTVFDSEDALEGLRAFKGKRPPIWKGR